MSRTLSGWTCLIAAVLFGLQTIVTPAFGAEAARGGEPISAARDGGEPVSDRAPSGHGSEIWGWVAGAAVIVAGAIVGYLLGDKSKKDKEDAQAAADEAAASAAAADAAAAGAAPAGETPLKHTFYITGEFRGAPVTWGNPPVTFTPSITFAVQTGTLGGIRDYVSSSTAASSGLGGEYEQTGEHTIMLRVNDGFYMGKASDDGLYAIILENNVRLSAVGGAIIRREHKE